MIYRAVGLLTAAALTAAALYVSPYWTFRLWDRNAPPLGIEGLRPQGDLVDQWVRGTPLDVYEVIVWGAGTLLALSLAQAVWSWLFATRRED